MGVLLKERNIVGFHDLTDYKKTPVFRAFEMVKREAIDTGHVIGSD